MITEGRMPGARPDQPRFERMALADKIGRELPATFRADGRLVVARSFPSDLMYSQVDIRSSSWRDRVSRWGIVDRQSSLLTLLSNGNVSGFVPGEVHGLRRVAGLRKDGHRVYRKFDGRETLQDPMDLGGWIVGSDPTRPEVQKIITQLEALGVPRFATIETYEDTLGKRVTSESFR